METLFKNWWMVALKGLLLLLFGLFAITKPGAAILTLVSYAGVVLLLAGIFMVIAALSNRDKKDWGWTLAEGLFDIILGGMILTHPFGSSATAATLFSIFMGFGALFGGIFLIGNAFRVRKIKGSRWGVVLLGGIVTLILGWMIITNPMANSVAITVIIGIFAIIFGIATIILGFALKSAKRKIDKILEGE